MFEDQEVLSYGQIRRKLNLKPQDEDEIMLNMVSISLMNEKERLLNKIQGEPKSIN